MVDLGSLGGEYSYGLAVNDHGQVAGGSGTVSGETHAFFWTPEAQKMMDLGTLGGDFSEAAAVNNLGQVVGKSNTESYTYSGFLLDHSRRHGGPGNSGRKLQRSLGHQ